MKKLINVSLSKIKLSELSAIKTEAMIIGTYESKKLEDVSKHLDARSKGVIKKLMSRDELSGSLGNSVYLPSLNGLSAEKIYLKGCGKKDKELNELEFLSLTQSIANSALNSKAKSVHIFLPSIKVANRDENWNFKMLAKTIESNSYKYFFKGKKSQSKNLLNKVSVVCSQISNLAASKNALKEGQIIGVGVNTSKELANTPANICTPSFLAAQAKSLSRAFPHIKTKVLGEKEMKKIGMDCLLSVGQGSVQESKFIIMQYLGGAKKQKT